MKLHILSDIHNEFSRLAPPETEADLIILAGDIDTGTNAIEWAKQFNKPVIYVLGNHEFYGQDYNQLVQIIKEETKGSNVHILDNEELVLDNIRFLGGPLWTDFNLFGEERSHTAKLTAQAMISDYKCITYNSTPLTPDDTVKEFNQTLAFLENKLKDSFNGKTVIITHHAPSLQSVSERYKNDILTPAFASEVTHLMSPNIALWIHGHLHNSADYTTNGTRVICNPRGYMREGQQQSENPAFNPKLIVEV